MMKVKPGRLMIGAVLAAGFIAAGAGGVRAAEERFITIGTGGQTGVYYVVGQSICRLVNRETERTGIKCTAPSTGGSVANINAIRAGQMDMGIAQSDVQYNALKGNEPFAGQGPFEELRAVFSVHPEPTTVVARDDSGIKTFDDLKGKRVNIGNPGSGQRAVIEALMGVMGWKMSDFALAAGLKAAEQAQAMCDNNVDAIVYTVGHPNGSIKEATTSCAAHLVPVAGPGVDKLVASNPYYAKVTIPGGMYTGTPEPTETFGVLATFVSSSKVPENVVYEVVKAVFDNFDRFKRLHPAFESLEPQKMIKEGLSAPLHDGARRYYQEKGWL
jgi:TRAP transporter TAXI family solute receptor